MLSRTHRSKLLWHAAAHDWAILFFGMGVKLPAKLVAIEESKIITATVSFIVAPKSWTFKVCASAK